jgi:hypothetical protein
VLGPVKTHRRPYLEGELPIGGLERPLLRRLGDRLLLDRARSAAAGRAAGRA